MPKNNLRKGNAQLAGLPKDKKEMLPLIKRDRSIIKVVQAEQKQAQEIDYRGLQEQHEQFSPAEVWKRPYRPDRVS